MATKAYDHLLKIILIGDSCTGKPEILKRFVDDVNSTFISRIGIDFKIKMVELDGKKVKLQIWDTAGQERFHSITPSYFRATRGVLLVYDVTRESSFDSVTKWLQLSREEPIGDLSLVAHIRNYEGHDDVEHRITNTNEDVQIMLLGNKCDLADKRMISRERGETLAAENGIKFLEVSAKCNINIEEAFMILTGDILAKIAERGPSEQNNASDTIKPDDNIKGSSGKSHCC